MKNNLVIISQKVVDRKGNLVGDDPKKFPSITNRCKELVAYLETGETYKVV